MNQLPATKKLKSRFATYFFRLAVICNSRTVPTFCDMILSSWRSCLCVAQSASAPAKNTAAQRLKTNLKRAGCKNLRVKKKALHKHKFLASEFWNTSRLKIEPCALLFALHAQKTPNIFLECGKVAHVFKHVTERVNKIVKLTTVFLQIFEIWSVHGTASA